jgi:PAS domain S-box-containing protein
MSQAHDFQSEVARRLAAEEALRRSEQRLAAQSEALTELTAPLGGGSGRFRAFTTAAAFEAGALEDRLRVILETCARTLGTRRVSIWRFTSDRLAISCIDLYDAGTREHSAGQVLHRRDHTQYFQALDHQRVIAAADARTDLRTRAFSESYLAPNDIGAMLDVPLRHKDDLMGVVCVEHVGGAREWTVDERNFVISVANLIVVATLDHERRAAQRRLADSEARAGLILDTAHDAFIGMDERGTIAAWNAQAVATFGWTAEEAIGRSLADTIIPESFREAHTRGLRRFLKAGDAPVVNKRLELTALHRDGREFPIEITITQPIRTESGYFFGAFLRDISERRDREAELHRAKESAEAATRAKSEFLANMSHELRTPLNGVLGYTQLLQRERSLSSLQREALDAIAKCGAHLLDLINDVLDLSKIEAGRIDVELAPCDIRQVTVDVKYVVAEPAHRKGLRLLIDVAPDVPSRAVMDGRHVRQVLLNLLGNAVKFTAAGEVRLAIAKLASPDRLRFEVADTGIGIDPVQLSTIFEAFGQTSDGAAAGGTGLGLTISQRLVRSMGGELQVASEAGAGSRFFFELPLVIASQSFTAPEPEVPEVMLDARLAPGTELTALVADDSSVNRRILASLLESAGARVITAAGGLEALDLARQHRPDVILMDLRMADLDGFEATRRLRADPATAGIPVLAVTASAFGDVRQAAVAAGCVDFVPKPVRAERLFAKLQQHLGVKFVRDADVALASTGSAGSQVAAVPHAVARRLRGAAAIGNVEAIEAVVQELMSGGPAEAALGAHVARLAAAFDYDGLLAVAASAELPEGQSGADR